MTQGTSTADTYEQFASVASEYGIEPRRVEPDGVAATVAEILEPPAVGMPLPWDDVTLPEDVETEPTPADLREATTGVTAASLAIAEYGSIVLDADENGSDSISLFNDLHVAVLHEDDIVSDMATAFEHFGERMRETRGSAVIATGPSATADMGELVQGAHGPERVEVLVVT
jgi:L-lactate dehydrogenase complex protein LldG